MSTEYPAPYRDFQLEIGRFVIHCTELEWTAFDVIHLLEPNEVEADRLGDQDFHPRILTLRKLSEERIVGYPRQEWLMLWEQVCSLTQDRNAILHNPIVVDILRNDAGEFRFSEPYIHRFRKRSAHMKPLQLDFVRRAADKAQSYSAEALRLWPDINPQGPVPL